MPSSRKSTKQRIAPLAERLAPIISPRPCASLQWEMSVAAPSGHVGNHDVIPGLKSLGNLHTVVGSVAEENLHAVGLLAVIGKFEESEWRTRARLQGPLDESGLRDLL